MADAHIIYDMPEEQYHEESGLGDGLWLTRSAVKSYCNDDPEWFHIAHVEKAEIAQFPGSDSTLLGSAVDAILEGTFDQKYAVVPDGMSLTTKEGRAWKAALPDGVERLPRTSKATASYDKALMCVRRLLRVPNNRYLMDKGKSQVVFRWTDDETGLRRQIRPDIWIPSEALGDWKTTADPMELFNRTAVKYGYDIQQVDYSDGVYQATGKEHPFFFGLVNTSRPFKAASKQLPVPLVESASVRLRAALRGIANGEFTNTYPANAVIEPLEAFLEFKLMTEDGIGYKESLA